MQKSLILLKPDTIQRGLVGEIVSRIEKKGLKVIAMKMMTLNEEILKDHYGHLATKPFFPEIVSYMTLGPVVAMVLEGEGAIPAMRNVCGATNPAEAAPGTIRGDMSMTIRFNLIHASDTEESATAEIARFFKKEEIYSYSKINENIL